MPTGEPPSAIDITTPTEDPVIGKPYTPQCIVTHADALQQAMVVIQWIGPSGQVLNTGMAIGNSSLPLNFIPLLLSDGGRYICRATIMSPLLDRPRTIERNLNLIPMREPGILSSQYYLICKF